MSFRNIIITLLIALFSASTSSAADKPVPAIEHVLIISVDGMRPDLMLRADTPRMHKMIDEGAFTLWAKTTPASVTLPSHVSMLTGVPPEVHGITWNADLELKRPVYPASPTIFDVARRAGLTTALCAGKPKFGVFDRPGAIDWKYISPIEELDDRDVTSNAIAMLHDHQPNVLFVHFAAADIAGHATGWGAPAQMAALAQIDRELGEVLDALASAKLTESTLVILTADHGGAGRTHGPEDPRSRTIPWIVVGPGVRKNFDLTRLGKELDVETYDTYATACAILGLTPPRRNSGKFIAQILEKQELVKPDQPKMEPSTNPSIEMK